VATTLAGGVSGASYRYSPHGAVEVAVGDAGAAASELGYAGALRLSGGLLWMGARVYDPALKIFLQPDPLAPFNYTYAGGDPINRWDPSGRADEEKECKEVACRADGGNGSGGDGAPPPNPEPSQPPPNPEPPPRPETPIAVLPPVTVLLPPRTGANSTNSNGMRWDSWINFVGLPGAGAAKGSGGQGAGTNGWFKRGVDKILNEPKTQQKLLTSASAILLGFEGFEIGVGLLTVGAASLPTPLAFVAPMAVPLGVTFVVVGLGSMAGGVAYGIATLHEAFSDGRRKRRPLTGTRLCRRRRSRCVYAAADRLIEGGRQ
jgi:RHS repeat-associated protein